jgi:LmbE family N-acetylglucosaminyl deacetylase
VNVLVIAPHPDDEAIGCGGAVLNHADAGDRVVVAVLTSGELGLKNLPREEAWRVREAESRAAAAILGTAATHFLRLPDWGLEDAVTEAAAALHPVLTREQPGLIYLPHQQDDHPDHRACLPIVRAALSLGQEGAVELRAFEVWSPLGTVDHFEDISSVIDQKLAAVRAYPSQLAQLPYDDAIHGLNRYRGVLSRQHRYAEAYSRPVL